jgi:hypothetical protein
MLYRIRPTTRQRQDARKAAAIALKKRRRDFRGQALHLGCKLYGELTKHERAFVRARFEPPWTGRVWLNHRGVVIRLDIDTGQWDRGHEPRTRGRYLARP